MNRTETVKARWTQEEISLLARREAELSLRGVRFINQELMGFLPDRTLESIKSVRKHADYRTLVQEHIARINRKAEASMTVGTQPAGVEEDCDNALLEYFRALSPPAVDEFRAASLHEICTHVGREERETTLEKLTACLLDVFPLPPESERNNQQRRVAGITILSRRKQRRVDYGRAQRRVLVKKPEVLLRRTYGRHRGHLGPPHRNYGSLLGSLNDRRATSVRRSHRRSQSVPLVSYPKFGTPYLNAIPHQVRTACRPGYSGKCLRRS